MSGGLTVTWHFVDGRTEERRTEVQAEVEACSRCGQPVELVAETDGHYLDDEDGRWHHESYGPATGVCCGLLYADWFDGPQVFDLETEREHGADDEAPPGEPTHTEGP